MLINVKRPPAAHYKSHLVPRPLPFPSLPTPASPAHHNPTNCSRPAFGNRLTAHPATTVAAMSVAHWSRANSKTPLPCFIVVIILKSLVSSRSVSLGAVACSATALHTYTHTHVYDEWCYKQAHTQYPVRFVQFSKYFPWSRLCSLVECILSCRTECSFILRPRRNRSCFFESIKNETINQQK